MAPHFLPCSRRPVPSPSPLGPLPVLFSLITSGAAGLDAARPLPRVPPPAQAWGWEGAQIRLQSQNSGVIEEPEGRPQGCQGQGERETHTHKEKSGRRKWGDTGRGEGNGEEGLHWVTGSQAHPHPTCTQDR